MEHYSNSDVVSIMEQKKIVQKPFILFIDKCIGTQLYFNKVFTTITLHQFMSVHITMQHILLAYHSKVD